MSYAGKCRKCDLPYEDGQAGCANCGHEIAPPPSDPGEARRPTVSELEAMLARDDLEIQIKPDGSIEAVTKPKIKDLNEILDGLAEKRRAADY